MKFVILLALIAYTAAQDHRPPHGDHGGDTLHHMIHAEVENIVQANAGISADDCTTKCDALFDLNANHDEQTTDKLCHEECLYQTGGHHGHGGN